MTEDTEMTAGSDDTTVGDAGPLVEIADDERRDFARYGGASGDFNPLHYNESYAREAGHSSVFGQDMFTVGIATDGYTVVWRRKYNRVQRSISKVVLPEETLVCTGEVTDVAHRDEMKSVEADIVIENEEDETIMTGSMTAELPR